jgi:hypothetical protein
MAELRDYEPLILHREPRFHVSLLANQRPRVILNAAWHADVGRYMAEHGLTDLSLNWGCGWPGGEIGFLAEIPGLRSVAILHARTHDLLPLLAHAATLEELVLDCNVLRIPGLSSMPALRSLCVDWARGLADAFDGAPHGLETLAVGRWPWEDLSAIAALQSLRILSVVGGRKLVDISALRGRARIEELTLRGCPKLVDFAAVSTCLGVHRLELASRSIRSLEFLRPLARLDRLIVDAEEIESLAPLEGLQVLRIVSIDKRILDRDLSVLERLPRLEWVGIRSRKVYSLSVKQLNVSLESRRKARG